MQSLRPPEAEKSISAHLSSFTPLTPFSLCICHGLLGADKDVARLGTLYTHYPVPMYPLAENFLTEMWTPVACAAQQREKEVVNKSDSLHDRDNGLPQDKNQVWYLFQSPAGLMHFSGGWTLSSPATFSCNACGRAVAWSPNLLSCDPRCLPVQSATGCKHRFMRLPLMRVVEVSVLPSQLNPTRPN